MKKYTILYLLAIGMAPLWSDVQLEKFAKDLVQKRTTVDTLSTELEIKKSELQSLKQQTSAQKTDLMRLVKSEETRLSKIQQDIGKLEVELKRQDVPGRQIVQMIMTSLDRLAESIQVGLPFKKDLRLIEVKTIKEMLVNKQLVPEKALSKLWSMLESEFRLTRENGLYRQNIEMGGTVHLADIVKIGMKMMFFKISETQTGVLKKKGTSYEYVLATKKEDIAKLHILFDNFQKKIRTGFFEIPSI